MEEKKKLPFEKKIEISIRPSAQESPRSSLDFRSWSERDEPRCGATFLIVVSLVEAVPGAALRQWRTGPTPRGHDLSPGRPAPTQTRAIWAAGVREKPEKLQKGEGKMEEDAQLWM